jgi:hypothetical protein
MMRHFSSEERENNHVIPVILITGDVNWAECMFFFADSEKERKRKGVVNVYLYILWFKICRVDNYVINLNIQTVKHSAFLF